MSHTANISAHARHKHFNGRRLQIKFSSEKGKNKLAAPQPSPRSPPVLSFTASNARMWADSCAPERLEMEVRSSNKVIDTLASISGVYLTLSANN